MAKTTQKFYDCDPYVPGMFPQSSRDDGTPDGDFFGNPLHVFNTHLEADLIGADQQIVAHAGAQVLELGFIAPLHDFERSRFGIQELLAGISDDLRTAQDALTGRAPLTPDTMAMLESRFDGSLPEVIVGYTHRAVGSIAVSDFGFTQAHPTSAMPERKHACMVVRGKEPVTVYMPTESFLAVTPPNR